MPVYYKINRYREEIEHLLANEQYVDGAKVEFVEVG